MGSGMLPTNAYVTLEHEYSLIFSKGERKRIFESKSAPRYESAYFWEERNRWFSDVWMDIKGVLQNSNHHELRARTAAFPLELPYRLINMYSIYGDTILDPFWGTGTTTLASMLCGRNSLGYEVEAEFSSLFDQRIKDIKEISQEINRRRVREHKEFVRERLNSNKDLKYKASNYNFPVVTKQEESIQFYSVQAIRKDGNCYIVKYGEFRDR